MKEANDWRAMTQEHIDNVREFLCDITNVLEDMAAQGDKNNKMNDKRIGLICDIKHKIDERAAIHDQCKLEEPEAPIFAEYTHKLKGMTYGSDEYGECLKQMKPALDHHYENSRHHPEHWENGINDMSLIDLLEMIADWKAATMRHADGCIAKSIDINGERFEMIPQLQQLLKNTVKQMGWSDKVDKNYCQDEFQNESLIDLVSDLVQWRVMTTTTVGGCIIFKDQTLTTNAPSQIDSILKNTVKEMGWE